MPERGDPQQQGGARELMNMTQLATALGVTRQWLHALRVKDPNFPSPERPPGSTRDVWDVGAVRAYYKARDRRPGERTDLKRPKPPATSG
jgi:predicted DNA-binding transcriptional regulator AlpA